MVLCRGNASDSRYCVIISRKLLTLHNPAHLLPESDMSYYLKYKKEEKNNETLENGIIFEYNADVFQSPRETKHSKG